MHMCMHIHAHMPHIFTRDAHAHEHAGAHAHLVATPCSFAMLHSFHVWPLCGATRASPPSSVMCSSQTMFSTMTAWWRWRGVCLATPACTPSPWAVSHTHLVVAPGSACPTSSSHVLHPHPHPLAVGLAVALLLPRFLLGLPCSGHLTTSRRWPLGPHLSSSFPPPTCLPYVGFALHGQATPRWVPLGSAPWRWLCQRIATSALCPSAVRCPSSPLPFPTHASNLHYTEVVSVFGRHELLCPPHACFVCVRLRPRVCGRPRVLGCRST